MPLNHKQIKKEMDTVKRVQIQDESVCVSFRGNSL